MRLLAFQGLRYTAAAGDAGQLAAPPYDQINDAARERFHAVSPNQFVHLTRPVPPAAGDDPYRWAAEVHSAWLRDGVVARDAEPALYPYIIDLAGGGRRLGVMALVGYEPPSVIRPHEQTLDKPLADRTALLEATHIDLEPALLLAEDDGQLETLLTADLGGPGTGRPPAVAVAGYRDEDGNHHQLFHIADPRRIAAYQQALASRPAAIADGHHRYKVGQRFAAAHHAPPGTAAAAKLAVVTSMLSPELTIDPIHRALRTRIDAGRLLALGGPRPAPPTGTTAMNRASAADATTSAGATNASTATSGANAVSGPGATPEPRRAAGVLVLAAEPFYGASGKELAAAVAAAPQPALGVWVAGQAPQIWQLAAASGAGSAASEGARDASAQAAPATTPTAAAAAGAPPAGHLAVEIFQDAVLPALGLGPKAATDGTLVYRSNPDELYSQVARGELGTGFWLPPMLPAEFAAAIAGGAMLPPKSTRFLPKAMSGLVWSDHESKVI
jgi:uncharacterized protein (DUF1015 family)